MTNPPPLKALIVEGSNPPQRTGIIPVSPNHWRVMPWLEYPEGTRVGIYGFRMDVLVQNRAKKTQTLELEVRWHHSGKILRQYLDYVHQQTGADRWRLCSGKVQGSSVHFQLRIPPGRWWLSVNPAWQVAQHRRWLAQLPRPARVRTTGIQEIILGDPRRPTLAVLARCHPYESASSVNAVGIVEWLLGNSSTARRILLRYCVRVVPMANPNGVALGCARLTHPGGHDLNIDFLPKTDPNAKALKRWLDECRPRLLLNFHSWMSKTHNGLFYPEEKDRRDFLKALGKPVWHGRRWLCIRRGADFKPGEPRQILDSYATNKLGALAYIVEFPWYGWTPARMRQGGVRAFVAAVRVLDGRR